MITREEMLELCRTNAPLPEAGDAPRVSSPPITSTVTYSASTFSAPSTMHHGGMQYVDGALVGMFLHCAECNTPLSQNPNGKGYWCDYCQFVPSLQDTYLARRKPFFGGTGIKKI
jgi:hypothetical protein